MFFFNGGEPTNTGTDNNAHALGIHFGCIQSRIPDRHIGGGQRKLRKAVHSPDGLFIDVFFGFKPFDFRINLAGIIRRVKKREQPHPRTTVLERVPIRFYTNTDGSNNPHTGDHDTFFHFDFMTGSTRVKPGTRMERVGRLTSSCGL
jgi:hypothetical protein